MLVYNARSACACVPCPAAPGLPQPYYNPENFFGNKQDIFTRCERD
jgi:hypothetical protein